MTVTGANPATVTIAVPLTLGPASGQEDIVQVDSGATLNLTNTVTTTSGATLRKRGQGTLNLAIDNPTLASAFTIDDGLVNIQSSNALGTGTVTVAAGATLDVSGGLTMTNALNLTAPVSTTWGPCGSEAVSTPGPAPSPCNPTRCST